MTLGGKEPKVVACPQGVEEAMKQVEKSFHASKMVVSEALEDSKMAANRLVKQGRYAVEDCMAETAHMVKRNPMGAIAVAFAAGAIIGLLMPRMARKD